MTLSALCSCATAVFLWLRRSHWFHHVNNYTSHFFTHDIKFQTKMFFLWKKFSLCFTQEKTPLEEQGCSLSVVQFSLLCSKWVLPTFRKMSLTFPLFHLIPHKQKKKWRNSHEKFSFSSWFHTWNLWENNVFFPVKKIKNKINDKILFSVSAMKKLLGEKNSPCFVKQIKNSLEKNLLCFTHENKSHFPQYNVIPYNCVTKKMTL